MSSSKNKTLKLPIEKGKLNMAIPEKDRKEQLPMHEVKKDVTVRRLTTADLDEIVRVEQETWPAEWQATRETFAERLALFPEGVVGVFVDGELAGVSTSMCSDFHLEDMPRKMYDPAYTWDAITDSGKLVGTHNPEGNAIYVVSVGVSSKHQGLGLGTRLVEAQKEVARKLDKQYVYLGAREPNLQAWVSYRYGLDVKLATKDFAPPAGGATADYTRTFAHAIRDLAIPAEDGHNLTLQEMADKFLNSTRNGGELPWLPKAEGERPKPLDSNIATFCSDDVEKPHSIAIRRPGDGNKPVAMEMQFYGKADLKPVLVEGRVVGKVGFADQADEESLGVGLIVYADVSEDKDAV